MHGRGKAIALVQLRHLLARCCGAGASSSTAWNTGEFSEAAKAEYTIVVRNADEIDATANSEVDAAAAICD